MRFAGTGDSMISQGLHLQKQVEKSTAFATFVYLPRKRGRGLTMYNAIDIARKVIANTDVDKGDAITNLKLQKLLFYLQGYWLGFHKKPLFNEQVEAWEYSPVIPSVYEIFKKYGKSAIDVEAEGKELKLKSNEDERLFAMIYETFNRYSAPTLVTMTHYETPWATTPQKGRGVIIDNKAMIDYFKDRIH